MTDYHFKSSHNSYDRGIPLNEQLDDLNVWNLELDLQYCMEDGIEVHHDLCCTELQSLPFPLGCGGSLADHLAEIAESLGYEVLGIDLFRTRLATATREMLREEIVLLRWPG